MNLFPRVAVVLVLLAGAALFMSFHKDLEVPLARPFEEFPAVHKGWRMAAQTNLSDDILNLLRPTEYLSRRYVREDGQYVDMYLSFFDGSPEGGRIHSPKNCLPGGGWAELSSERVQMNIDGETVNLVRAVYGSGDDKEVLYYWFAMRGQTISDEVFLKLAEITGSIFYRRQDQSFIRISVQAKDNVDVTQERIEDFLMDFYPVIREYLPS
jgi:EpsI family protein